MKNTIQRQIILSVLQKMHNHPTVEDVCLRVHKEHPTVSKSTVYRILHQFTESGEIKSILVPDSPERFDGCLLHHYHFRCKTCGEIFDVNMEYLSEINSSVQSAYGFKVDGHDVMFKGICRKCSKEGGRLNS